MDFTQLFCKVILSQSIIAFSIRPYWKGSARNRSLENGDEPSNLSSAQVKEASGIITTIHDNPHNTLMHLKPYTNALGLLTLMRTQASICVTALISVSAILESERSHRRCRVEPSASERASVCSPPLSHVFHPLDFPNVVGHRHFFAGVCLFCLEWKASVYALDITVYAIRGTK